MISFLFSLRICAYTCLCNIIFTRNSYILLRDNQDYFYYSGLKFKKRYWVQYPSLFVRTYCMTLGTSLLFWGKFSLHCCLFYSRTKQKHLSTINYFSQQWSTCNHSNTKWGNSYLPSDILTDTNMYEPFYPGGKN